MSKKAPPHISIPPPPIMLSNKKEPVQNAPRQPMQMIPMFKKGEINTGGVGRGFINHEKEEITRREMSQYYGNMLQETRPKRSAEIEPLAAHSHVIPVNSNKPTFYDAESYTFGSIQSQAPSSNFGGFTSENSTNSKFKDVIERPQAPSPGQSQTFNNNKPFLSPLEIIAQKGEEFLKEEEEKKKHPDNCKNLVDFIEAQDFIEYICEKYGIYKKLENNSMVYGPLGVNLKRKIIESWKLRFITCMSREFKGDVTEIESPLQHTTSSKKVSISQCENCKFIVDAIELIKDSANQNYDGSTLDQLQKKLAIIKAKCPKCKGELSDPMSGFNEATITIGGTLYGATGDDGNIVADPTLYKLVPNSILQQHMALKDPLEELKKDLKQKEEEDKVKEVTGNEEEEEKGEKEEIVGNEKKKEEKAKEKEKEEDRSRSFIKLSWASSLNENYEWVSKHKPENIGIAQVGALLKSRIGETFTRQLSHLYHSQCTTEMCAMYYNLPSLSKESIASVLNGDALFSTIEDQYLSRKESRRTFEKIIPHLIPLSKKVQTATVATGAIDSILLSFVLANVIEYLQNIGCKSETLVVRQALPCETEKVVWVVESKYFPSEKKCRDPLFTVTYDQSRITCEANLEVLMYYVLLYSVRRDETRDKLWMKFQGSVSPCDVVIESSGGKFASSYVTCIKNCNLEYIYSDKQGSDEIGSPLFLTIMKDSANKSAFEVEATIRCRDSQECIKKSLMDFGPYLQLQINNN